ncbi:MAG: enoyl-CoA hydratase [Acidimicrobiia bacterium]|nr:enoyl-CoA hydratase [Acidimicrobiia bacterium]
MSEVEVISEGRIRTIRLTEPARRNVLSLSTLRQLREAVLATPADIGVVIIEADGPVFSAGHDIAEMIDRTPEFYDELFAACTNMMLSIEQIPQPVIAKVQGPATAAGCQLVASCDLAVASNDAWFATPGVKIGLFCSTPMVPVSRAVGRKRAMEMLLTGDPVPAETAADWGLINRAVPASDLNDEVATLANKILEFSADTVGRGKKAFYQQLDRDVTDAYRTVEPVMAANAASADAQEGMTAFVSKRQPVWPGKTLGGES